MALFNRRKRDVEPILAISIVIFLVASGAVVSMSFYGNYVNEEDLPVAPGREIEVYYTGSLYGYYYEEGALIFDSNIKEHVENEDELYSFIGGFSKTESEYFETLGFTHGWGELLVMFENALTGHKAGDTVEVMIPIGKGYDSEEAKKSDTFSVTKEELMSLDKFESLYGEYGSPESGLSLEPIKTIYGWDAPVTYDSVLKKVIIHHNPDVGEEYDLKSNELNVHGSVKVKPTSVGDEIECEIVLDVKDENKDDYMLWVKTHSEEYYIFGKSEDGSLRTTESPAAEGDIYFVITIESVSERD